MHFKIEDSSMEPVLKAGDYIVVNKLAYAFSNPSKGDIIVMKHPKEKDRFLVKRIELVTKSKKLYVIGDNKNYSQDSRHFGPIVKNLIIGKLFLHIKQ